MSIRIKNDSNGQEYVSSFSLGSDITFPVKSGETAPVDVHEYISSNVKGQYTIPIIFASWICFMTAMATVASIAKLVSNKQADNNIDVIENSIETVTYSFSAIIVLIITIALILLIKKLHKLNNTINRNEYLWRTGTISEYKRYQDGHNIVIVDGENIIPLTHDDYEKASIGDEFIVVYRLNKAKTQIMNVYAFYTDFNKDTTPTEIIDSYIHETSDTVPDEIHNKLYEKAKNVFISRLPGCIFELMPFVILISILFMEIPCDNGTTKSINFMMAIIKDSGIINETYNNPVVFIPLLLIVFVILITLIGNIRYIIKTIAFFQKVRKKDYEWRIGTITGLQTESHNKHTRQYIYVDNECCKPLSFMDFVSSSKDQEAIVIYINIATYKTIPYAFVFEHSHEQ